MKNLREIVITSLLIAIGFVLHAIAPGIAGMKPDLLITFMLIAIILHPSMKNTIAAGMLGGLMAALTTTFPGGQIPNLVDKLVTALAAYALLLALSKMKQEILKVSLIGLIGTFISGTVFLGSALLIAGLPVPFSVLFFSVVVPAAVINTVLIGIVYKATRVALKSLIPSRSH